MPGCCLTGKETSDDGEAGKGTAENGGLWFGAGLGVGMAFVVFIFGGLLVWLWRRQWVLPCSGKYIRSLIKALNVRLLVIVFERTNEKNTEKVHVVENRHACHL